ncbi:tRNA (mnm(5)s(2)U34)-methyltransferase [Cohnella mopanensis]|uniref:tRNA (mnm(5)s(2)U34)-methyltransferase n=1 Tax=Cohnella mopanensis TaxID=2911966 RepID=UPI001EF93ED9|nr:class I SAM-dependent methyltransferase [Cohnella mopanensis]
MGFLSVLSQAQRWVKERAQPGDIVVDATAGNGSDTLFLSRTVGARGSVYSFDIQAEALENSKARRDADIDPSALSPIYWIHAGHETMESVIDSKHHGRIAAIMFNLGYLPGASPDVITKPPTTLAALDASLRLLRSGGVLTIVVYPGHDGGQEEADAVERWASNVSPSIAQAVTYRFPQKKASPYLIALNRK